MKFLFDKLYDAGLAKILRDNPRILRRLNDLLDAIEDSPRGGMGFPEQLKGYRPRVVWSRHITRKHRLVYEIRDKENCIVLLSCYGHYKDH
jgi:toxin YoeB